jgi:hypothetical protein
MKHGLYYKLDEVSEYIIDRASEAWTGEGCLDLERYAYAEYFRGKE